MEQEDLLVFLREGSADTQKRIRAKRRHTVRMVGHYNLGNHLYQSGQYRKVLNHYVYAKDATFITVVDPGPVQWA